MQSCLYWSYWNYYHYVVSWHGKEKDEWVFGGLCFKRKRPLIHANCWKPLGNKHSEESKLLGKLDLIFNLVRRQSHFLMKPKKTPGLPVPSERKSLFQCVKLTLQYLLCHCFYDSYRNISHSSCRSYLCSANAQKNHHMVFLHLENNFEDLFHVVCNASHTVPEAGRKTLLQTQN